MAEYFSFEKYFVHFHAVFAKNRKEKEMILWQQM